MARKPALSKMFEAVGARKADIIDDDQLAGVRREDLSGLRFLFGNVHSQQHELPLGGNRHRPSGKRHHPGGRQRQDHVWLSMPVWPSWSWWIKDIKARDIINEKSIQKRPGLRYGFGLLFQQRASSPGNRQRSRRGAGPGACFNEISAKVPNLCHLAPAGGTHMHDLNNAGGVSWLCSAELNKKGSDRQLR